MSHRQQALTFRQRRLTLIDRLEVVFNRARREHAKLLSDETPDQEDVRKTTDNPTDKRNTLLADAIATPDGKRRYVRTLFSTIADRYDLITVVLSYGQDQRWKRRLVDLASRNRNVASRGARALDLATGTGDIAFRLAASGWDVVGLDVTRRM